MFRKKNTNVRTASGPSVERWSSWATPIASEAKTSGNDHEEQHAQEDLPDRVEHEGRELARGLEETRRGLANQQGGAAGQGADEETDQDTIGKPGARFSRHFVVPRHRPAPAMVTSAGIMRLTVLIAVLILAGCSAVGPAAEQLYPAHAASDERVPVILIPGLLGSRLKRAEDGVEVWPGGTRKLLTSDYAELALRIDPETLEPLDDGLVPGDIFEGAAGKDFYRRLMRELREAGGYQFISPGHPVVQQRARLYVFTYDWRQDIVKTVGKLDELIEQIRRDYGDPSLRVDVVAHSMGGVVVRYFERYGAVDVLGGNSFPVTGLGLSKLRRVVLLGTPNQGTVTAVHKFLNGYRVGISALPTEGVATMPSTFQLFPHPLVDWVVNINGKRLTFDIFDTEFWRRYEWSIFDHRIQRRMDAAPRSVAAAGCVRALVREAAGARPAFRVVADGTGRRRTAREAAAPRRRLRADATAARVRKRRRRVDRAAAPGADPRAVAGRRLRGADVRAGRRQRHTLLAAVTPGHEPGGPGP